MSYMRDEKNRNQREEDRLRKEMRDKDEKAEADMRRVLDKHN